MVFYPAADPTIYPNQITLVGGQPDPHPVRSPNQTNLVAEQPDPAVDPHRVGQSSLVAGQPDPDCSLCTI